MPRSRKTWDEHSIVTGHTKQFNEPLRFCNVLPLGNPGDACQVYKAEVVGSGQVYAVKMFKSYSNEQMSRDRFKLRQRGYDVSDKALENYFHPWHRESRAYEQIECQVPQSKHPFFLKYYGTARIPFSSVPAYWTRTMPFEELVPIVVLEFFEGSSANKDISNIQISQESLTRARVLHTQLGHGPAHIYVHIMEILETLHAANIIHGDLKPDAFTYCSDTGRLVMFDFSLSWVSENGLPCLDPFNKHPITFSHQSRSECKDIEVMITNEYGTLQNKISFLAGCRNCVGTMEPICSGLHTTGGPGV